MLYIIDANNLGGRMGILDDKNFDRKLIGLIKHMNKQNMILVFDSGELMGDKRVEGGVTIIYTPKDGYYASADDKVLELATSNYKRDEITVITDDRELREKIQKFQEEKSARIVLMYCSEFMGRMQRKIWGKREDSSYSDQLADSEDGDRNLSDQEMKKINDELLDIWKER